MNKKHDAIGQIGAQNLNDMLNELINDQAYVTPEEERDFVAKNLPNQGKVYKGNRSLGGAIVGGIIKAITLPAIITARLIEK